MNEQNTIIYNTDGGKAKVDIEPNLKGYSRRNIYNMVMFYEEYSKAEFCNLVEKYIEKGDDAIVQFETAQLPIVCNES